MPSRSPQTSIDRQTYIPPQVESAIGQRMQESLPANLRSYTDPGHTGYVPPQVERAIAEHLEKAVPAHLKQYTGAYVQQRVAQTNMARSGFTQSSALSPRPPTPDLLKLSHSMPTGEQFTAQFNPPPTEQSSSNAQSTPQSQPASPQSDGYEFIVNPPAPGRRGLLRLPGQSSALMRLVMLLGGILVLAIIFIIIKNILGGGPNFSGFVSIAQDQQELVHLSTNSAQQQGLTTTNQNFGVTAKLALTSSQTQLLTYLKNNHTKVSTKTLNLKVSASLDSQLTTAAANSTYNQTFQQIMLNQLTGYEQALKQAYNGAGAKGRQLLNNDYQQAQLLTTQLSSPAS